MTTPDSYMSLAELRTARRVMEDYMRDEGGR
jgi:hypothetical protein